MPLQTPSPHRFLAPAPPATQRRQQKPRSGLRHVQTPRPTALHSRGTHDETDEPRRVIPAKRFVVPPPSSRNPPNGGERRRGRNQVGEAWPDTQATPRPKPWLSKAESIDCTSPSSSPNTVARGSLNVLPSVEQSSILVEDEDQEDETEEEEILFGVEERNKRRRVSPHPSTSPIHAHAGPATPHQQSSPQIASPVSHRFKVTSSRPTVPVDASTPMVDRQTNSRPHFILPHLSPSSTKSAVPLPETFSPSRKHGKYILNGMASTLQSWIHETASAGYTANTSSAVTWGRDKEDGVKLRVEVLSIMGGRGGEESEVECWPGGVIFLRGVTDANLSNAAGASGFTQPEGSHNGCTEIKIMLAGQGGARGKGGVRVREGGFVGVRAPIWDVHVGQGPEEEKWLVGVEWMVL
ncbi:hypothetical protein P171DRAFT_120907 [Karstenula rhodostoma CBS 690.94]|uniref:Uncharacterized protein n=1 Tax=Karstenula rhodostoma CBS 690.94 TaxID=1392251 RepID=A0A9P4P8N5_9PLEO|nr:hypothetical protein P171DRAFT_120907 [Karstenula rhodostoma CBS 690.94]